jgi:hypothetical protein
VHRFVAALVVLAALVPAGAALAAGPSYVAEGGLGVLSPDGKVRYVAVSTGIGTAIERVAVHGGAVTGWAVLDGAWGIPQPTLSSTRLEGLTRDGRRLVVATAGFGDPTQFAVVRTGDLRIVQRFDLRGSWAYDALSPDGKTLYLTHYVDRNNTSRYVVRAYDLEHRQLLPGIVADRTQRGWVMDGLATTRTTSTDGRWVYTLFMRPGGYPFVHALDTVNRVAHCIGLPWSAVNQGPLINMRMTLTDGGSKLALHWRSGKPWRTVDTATWQITRPTTNGLPWRWIAAAATAALALLAVAALLARRRGGHAREEALPQPL